MHKAVRSIPQKTCCFNCRGVNLYKVSFHCTAMSETISCLLIGWEQANGGAHRENCCGLHPTITPRCWHSSHWGNNRVYLLQMLPYLHFFFWLTSKNAEQWLNLLLATDRNLSYQACIGPRHLLLVFFCFFRSVSQFIFFPQPSDFTFYLFRFPLLPLISALRCCLSVPLSPLLSAGVLNSDFF